MSISIINTYSYAYEAKPCSYNHPYRDLLNSSVNVFTTFCKKPIYDTIKILELRSAYKILITHALSQVVMNIWKTMDLFGKF